MDKSTVEDKSSVLKAFDCPLSQIGKYQAFKIGVRLGEVVGREKTFCFIVSPQLRCLQTVEHMIMGLDIDFIKLYQGKIFVEDAIREWQSVPNVQSFDNFDKLHFFEEKNLIRHPTVLNQLEFLKDYNSKERFEWPETPETLTKRVLYCEEKIKEFAKNNSDLTVVWVSHGFFTENFRRRAHIPRGFYHYGSVNRYEMQKDGNWALVEIDGKYY